MCAKSAVNHLLSVSFGISLYATTTTTKLSKMNYNLLHGHSANLVAMVLLLLAELKCEFIAEKIDPTAKDVFGIE